MGCLLTALLKRQKSAIDPAMSCDCLHCCKPLTFTTEGVQDIGPKPRGAEALRAVRVQQKGRPGKPDLLELPDASVEFCDRGILLRAAGSEEQKVLLTPGGFVRRKTASEAALSGAMLVDVGREKLAPMVFSFKDSETMERFRALVQETVLTITQSLFAAAPTHLPVLPFPTLLKANAKRDHWCEEMKLGDPLCGCYAIHRHFREEHIDKVPAKFRLMWAKLHKPGESYGAMHMFYPTHIAERLTCWWIVPNVEISGNVIEVVVSDTRVGGMTDKGHYTLSFRSTTEAEWWYGASQAAEAEKQLPLIPRTLPAPLPTKRSALRPLLTFLADEGKCQCSETNGARLGKNFGLKDADDEMAREERRRRREDYEEVKEELRKGVQVRPQGVQAADSVVYNGDSSVVFDAGSVVYNPSSSVAYG
mmetsp:Transcript_2603/g.6661  ORF Transcript_2603/g.6661 Transcript_2603/m.6661 type:complete len:420 (+) Transcript_2603:3-1262(+)